MEKAWQKWRQRFASLWELKQMAEVAEEFHRVRRLDRTLQTLKAWVGQRKLIRAKFRTALGVSHTHRHAPPQPGDVLTGVFVCVLEVVVVVVVVAPPTFSIALLQPLSSFAILLAHQQ